MTERFTFLANIPGCNLLTLLKVFGSLILTSLRSVIGNCLRHGEALPNSFPIKMRPVFLRTLPILLCANHAFSWGDMGHRAVAYLSQQYMTPEAIQLFNRIIQPNGHFDISDAAVWADQHKDEHTYNWHFIDARDTPPSHCNIKYNRDCDFRDECAKHKEPGCVVSAIVNQVRVFSRKLITLQLSSLTVEII